MSDFDRDQQHFQFAAGSRAEDLIVPHHFLQRKRHVLLRFVLDDLRDLAGIYRRQFDEFGKTWKPGAQTLTSPGLDAFFREHFLQAP